MVVQSVLRDSELNQLASCCKGLEGLIQWLDSIDQRPTLAELDRKLTGIRVNLDELNNHIGYSDSGYQRNVLKKTEHYELVTVCWKPGQHTPIHDHIGSDCAFVILEGTCTETQYELNSEGLAIKSGQRIYSPGEVCAADEPDIHRVSNLKDGNLINLHVYTPPLSGFGIYRAAE
jgi:cysteine dioxygenase